MTIISFILTIGALILIHEIGHYVAALIVKIPIQEFGIGFPPRMLKLFKANETEFTLNWLPLGGFVRAKERPGDEETPDEMMAATPWKRIFMLLAGSTVNILAAVLMVAFAYFKIGQNIDHVLIVSVDQGSPAEAAGILPEDQIMAINGAPAEDIDQVQEMIETNKGLETEFTLLRGDETFTVTMTPRTEYNPHVEGATGVGLFPPLNFLEAILESIHFLWRATINLFSQSVELIGYKGMFDEFSAAGEMDAAGTGVTAGTNRIWFIASISFSLGLLNLLPIPIFDGGKILLALPELLFKRRVPINLYYILNITSLALVLFLMVYVNIKDFVDPAIVQTLTPIP
jgi:regulator of sigma E protease